jgi:hypothetical protein
MPYKFPKDIDSLTNKQILVDGQASTCTPSLKVIKGNLNVPADIKPLLNGNETDLCITGDDTPFDALDSRGANIFLYSDNSFILSGEVIGYDSTFKEDCGQYCALYKIHTWSPTEYYANFWTFSYWWFIIYFLLIFTGILTSVIIFINRGRKINNT